MKLMFALMNTFLVTRLIGFILKKNSIRPTVSTIIAAGLSFIVLVVLWVGTSYAASAVAYYGASGIAWLIFDLYRLSTTRAESNSDGR